MRYPCIVYEPGATDTDYADDISYRRTKRYQVTVIDRNPDSLIPDTVAQLRLCRHNRFFTANNLNHHVFDLYF